MIERRQNRLKDVLAQRLRDGFVGREAELAELGRLHRLAREGPQLSLISGPAGIGKTLLARRFAADCAGRVVHVPVDKALDLSLPPMPADFGDAEQPDVLVFDASAPIDFDACARFLELAGASWGPLLLILVCTRSRTSWRARVDPSLGAVITSLALENFTREQAAELVRRHVETPGVSDHFFALTGGHPLALALMVERQRHDPSWRASWTGSPDLLALLLREFLADAPTPRHREVLELASLVEPLTEELAAAVLGRSVREELAWLWECPLCEVDPDGVRLAPVARDVISRAVRRDPHKQAGLARRLGEVHGASRRAPPEPSPGADIAPRPVPDEASFGAAVRAALQAFHRPHELTASPLYGCALLERSARAVDTSALQALLSSVIGEMEGTTGYASEGRLLRVTFVEPSTKQLAAAAELGLPYGTYRHRLRAALGVIAKLLWQRELEARRELQQSSA